MKKLLLFILIIFLAGPLCFAKKYATFLETPSTAVFAGKTDSVRLGDSANGEKSEIVVVADDGKIRGFTIASDTVVYDKDGKVMTLNKITKNSKVVVTYETLKRGKLHLVSIKVVDR